MRYLLLWLVLFLFIGEVGRSFAQELPIKPARTISFTTTEGTGMNIDLSPDGRTLLFDLLGDIYTLPVTGGKATQLTRGIALNLHPIWSPDGKNIAYVSDYSGARHLNIMNAKNTFHIVAGRSGEQIDFNYPVPFPLWTPDGNYILCGDSTYGIAGGNISSQISFRDIIRFSGDGKFAWYLDEGKLYRYNCLEKTKAILATDLTKGYRDVALSPDEHWLIYVIDSADNAAKHLVVRNIAGNQQHVLVPDLYQNDNNYSNLSRPFHIGFSPDSRNVFISYKGKIHRIVIASGADKVIPFSADVKVDMGSLDYNTFRVTHDPLKVKYTRSANASSDGKHLVFSALNKIYVMDLPNGKPHVLIHQQINQFQPVYSPDGKWIAYVSWCDTVGGFLWRVPAFGGKPEKLTQIPGKYQRPAWSPDGEAIAVIKGEPQLGYGSGLVYGKGTGQLQLISVINRRINAIADSVPLWNQLAFSGDGKRLIYEPPFAYCSHNLLVSRDTSGTNLNVLAVGQYTDDGIYLQKSISPDGRYMIYSKGEDMYLVPVCKIADKAVLFDPTKKLSVIRFAQGQDAYWDKGSKALCWSYGNQYFRVNPDKVITTAEKVLQMYKPSSTDGNIVTAWVVPDETITLDVTVPKYYAQGTIVLKNARIITMRGNQVIEHGMVVIKNGRFVAVGSGRTINIPQGSKIIDLTGKTIMPGLINTHAHFGPPDNIFPQQHWNFLFSLAYGITTARDPAVSYDSFGYSELLESGQMIGPRYYPTGRAVMVYPFSGDNGIILNNLDDARDIVNKRKELGGTFMKQYMLDTRIQREWLLRASKEAGLNMTNEGEYDPVLALAQLKDGSSGIEHNPGGDIYKDITTAFARSGTYFTPTLQVRPGYNYLNYMNWHQQSEKLSRFDPKDAESIISTGADAIKDTDFIYAARIDAQIRKEGGKVATGTDDAIMGVAEHNEIWALQMGGLTNMQALQAATITGAEAIGIQKDVGSIEVGKIADLVILNKNPLDDIHNSREIKYVMKDGVLYDGDTLDELWPVYKKCPEWQLSKKYKPENQQ